MKYWKQGFYDTLIDGAIEISEEYYNQLLAGQSAGLLIVESKQGYPVLVEYESTIKEKRAQKLNELQLYDSSEAVNQFTIDNVSGWLNKSTRVRLMNSINIERESGRSETSIWLDETQFILSIEKAIDMLQQIELYALACYDTTQRHISTINQLETKEEIESYDYYVGYPGKLSFGG
ncbi:DUF4376 domain-containing protein [Bacteroides ovatus]|uniref:DUF4376 domain-containing protein n=1 Tax=Bacteroides ovatus TaxID=28116 RepID=A0A5M5D559_BACOV|nr:DUF4376 domain-containing protein [Bacteroides ovatus]KAA4005600.1 DUF4376 domain-containing protein [Bacteroides ovatus]KAA4016910.1 DUF4376 domain-containing protein [Bacteroides ovatus]KAA4028854.1 DUF4376 domain-containing protein [Bacteroides ovatus]KAA4034464.1 DUF4376 domain-containing protein [Bacteroides ovatus]